MKSEIRPLRRAGRPGVWYSRDWRWTFLRHDSDPHPQRWFIFLDADPDPYNVGGGEITLDEVVEVAQEAVRAGEVPELDEPLTGPMEVEEREDTRIGA